MATCPNTTPFPVAQALTKCKAVLPVLASPEFANVLPSMAIGSLARDPTTPWTNS